jgi:hypothetical protein
VIAVLYVAKAVYTSSTRRNPGSRPAKGKTLQKNVCLQSRPCTGGFSFGSDLFVKSIGSLRNALRKATHGPRHNIKQVTRKNAQKVCMHKLVKLGL